MMDDGRATSDATAVGFFAAAIGLSKWSRWHSSRRARVMRARIPAHKSARLADSIKAFGFVTPVLIDDTGEFVAGHGRVAAAKLLGLTEVPTVRLSHLTPAQRRAYLIADNAIATKAGWDRQLLAVELQALIEIDFEVSLTGFEMEEVEVILDGADQGRTTPPPNRNFPDPSLVHPSAEPAINGCLEGIGFSRGVLPLPDCGIDGGIVVANVAAD